jgi:hypothetical protein
LKVCALNAGRTLNPEKDFQNHRIALGDEVPGIWRPQDPRTILRLAGQRVPGRCLEA